MLLVDGNHLASRNRFARTRQLCTSGGTPSGVVYGFFNGLSWVKTVLSRPTQQIVVFWDGGRSKRRKEIYPEYKSNRKPPSDPDEIAEQKSYYEQIDAISCALSHLGIRQVKVRHVEADDLLSIFSATFSEISQDVVIFTGDHDLWQCASDSISIFDPKHELLKFSAVLEKSVLSSVADIPKLKALAGDASDAIAGVPKIGDVWARRVLPFWDEIFSDAAIDSGLGPVAKYLKIARDNREIVRRNFDIIRLPRKWSESFYELRDATDANAQICSLPCRNTAEFIRFCKQWELTTILERLDNW